MHIVVCAKRIPDPEISGVSFKIDPETQRRVELPGLKMVMSPYDEQCFEAALRVRESQDESVRITALCLGQGEDVKIFKDAFAWDADEGIFISDPAFVSGDGYTTATVLSAAIEKLGDVDLILVGRQAADRDEGVVGYGIAELLGIPLLPCAADVKLNDGLLVIERFLDNGSEILEAALPVVVTISNEIGTPRKPTMRQIMKAGRKKPETWNATDLGLDVDQPGVGTARLLVEEIFVPDNHRECEFVTGDTPAECAQRVVDQLKELRVLS